MWEHGGSTVGFRSIVMYLPDHGTLESLDSKSIHFFHHFDMFNFTKKRLLIKRLAELRNCGLVHKDQDFYAGIAMGGPIIYES